MRSRGDDDRRPTPEEARRNIRELTRESSRSNRRGMLMILGLVVVVMVAQQVGIFGDGAPPAEPLDRVASESFDAELAALPLVPVLDADSPGVRVVEFFDYRCGHCRRMAPVIHDALAGDAGFELVPIELPLLGPESVLASRYALAAALQGGYAPFHRALMFSTVPYTPEGLRDLGQALGLDPEQLAADADGAAVTEALEANRRLAASVGIDGTPTFVIGDIVIVGAMDEASFLGLVAAANDERN